ncbi:MAG: hypothetical protein DI536_17915 [Archangium gephyra]|uniref:MoaD/ThiS family protein n=1 Tax=Archangium gephyra TaxID=48 RepID=A0A2W5VM93_9BACT|nr:MAG: hypothetical protein DI536_17915 [Archangium gephyra]
MNITVIIPRALQAACEGRAKIELGVPSGSDLGEIITTLMTLYPGLKAFVASEKRPLRQHFGVARAGQKVFLFTSTVSPNS